MTDNSYKFELPKHHKSIIKVIGVGGGGSNAVNHMFNQGIKDVEFVVCNTDLQALKGSHIPTKLQIGVNLTEGLGAGANPEKGRNAALESKEDIRELLSNDTKMVFITAGMGGGTGTGAAPVIAKVSKDLDVLTVGIVTMPFAFEGKKKMAQALLGIEEMRKNCDTVLVILNDKLREIYGNLSIGNAFAQADNILTTAAKGIAEIITVAGYVNVDFQDVRTVMHNAGAAVMGSSTTEGEGRAIRAAEGALLSPLLDNKDILGAQKILLSIISGDQAELQMDELTEITEYIQEKAGDDAEVIFGHGVDSALGNSIRVTVIATGFDADYSQAKFETFGDTERRVLDLEKSSQITLFSANNDVNENQEMELRKSKETEEEEAEETDSIAYKGYSFLKDTDEEDEQEELFEDEDEFTASEKNKEEEIGDEGMMERIRIKERLQEQAQERIRRLAGKPKPEMDSEEFKSRLEVPAYLRKKVPLQNTPHSSERNISRYNLNEDSKILGNNKFLHDNVD